MLENQPKPSRRGFFMGAAAVSAASGIAVLASNRLSVVPTVEAVATVLPMPEKGGGYSLSDHVKHYYKTAQI